MSKCNPSPETTCGTTINDTCVIYTGNWPTCLEGTGHCFRQSDFNSSVGGLLCSINTSVTNILNSILLTGLTGCETPLEITPVKTTVAAEFQNIYNILCANLPVSLNTPIVTGAAPGLDLKCLEDPCGVPIGTLGGVLQSLINITCAEKGLSYKALLTQSGTAAPTVNVLADTIDPAQANISVTRTGVGVYVLTANLTYLPNGFPANRTIVSVGTAKNFTNQIIAYWQSSTQIIIETAVSGTHADSILSNTPIQIEIF